MLASPQVDRYGIYRKTEQGMRRVQEEKDQGSYMLFRYASTHAFSSDSYPKCILI